MPRDQGMHPVLQRPDVSARGSSSQVVRRSRISSVVWVMRHLEEVAPILQRRSAAVAVVSGPATRRRHHGCHDQNECGQGALGARQGCRSMAAGHRAGPFALRPRGSNRSRAASIPPSTIKPPDRAASARRCVYAAGPDSPPIPASSASAPPGAWWGCRPCRWGPSPRAQAGAR